MIPPDLSRGGGRCNSPGLVPAGRVTLAGRTTFSQINTLGAFHSVTISEISGQKSNGTGKVPERISVNLGLPNFELTQYSGKSPFLLGPSFSEA